MAEVLVIYESMFGNTEAVARAIAEGVGSHHAVRLAEVGSIPAALDSDVRLLVIGGPTHAFGMSRPSTRESAVDQATNGVVSRTIGIREWLAALPEGRSRFATFDTRIRKPRLPGSAAARAARRLRRLGYRMATKPRTFYVHGTPGPLLEGELDRARRWGQELKLPDALAA
jgi:hypothetical protein